MDSGTQAQNPPIGAQPRPMGFRPSWAPGLPAPVAMVLGAGLGKASVGLTVRRVPCIFVVNTGIPLGFRIHDLQGSARKTSGKDEFFSLGLVAINLIRA